MSKPKLNHSFIPTATFGAKPANQGKLPPLKTALARLERNEKHKRERAIRALGK